MQPDTTTHLFLVGFMGSGKSSVGPLLANRLGRAFYDLDQLVEEEEGTPVSGIFSERGESYFRSLESRLLRRLVGLPPAVIALGGGAFSSPENRSLIRRSGTSVWLEVSLEAARERCLKDPSRPLAQDEARFNSLFHSRQPIYQTADAVVKVEQKPVDKICDEIVALVSQQG
jgi:shikimate kinase